MIPEARLLAAGAEGVLKVMDAAVAKLSRVIRQAQGLAPTTIVEALEVPALERAPSEAGDSESAEFEADYSVEVEP